MTFGDEDKRLYIEENTKLMMPNCEGYNKEFCDATICFECNKFDKNLSIEFHKLNNLCPRCQGFTIISMFMSEFLSATTTCNQCGGSGKFYNYND